MKTVIFTDLDGTLLHPADYSTTGAEEALSRIRDEDIPLVFSSSKTKAEIEAVRNRLSNTHPFISENGGGTFIPVGYFPLPTGGQVAGGCEAITLGVPYRTVREALAEAGRGIKGMVRGFGEMTAGEIAALTGLTQEEAKLAKLRDFDEPFVFDGPPEELERLLGRIEETGFTWTSGRFLHILGPHDKGRAVRILKDFYQRVYGKVITICLGNGGNDVPMLREADYPVLVMNEENGYYDAGIPGLIKADGVGPVGWGRAVTSILDSIAASTTG